MAKYSELLKDPRWQRKRLKILERDGFLCQSCLDGESTLHVHHTVYSKGLPWEVPDSCLITLCENCHAQEEGLKGIDMYSLIANTGLTRNMLVGLLDLMSYRLTTVEGNLEYKVGNLGKDIMRPAFEDNGEED